MSEKIEIGSTGEGYTAKEAMRRVVNHMHAKTEHVITVITLDEKSWDSESVLFWKMFLRFLHKNRGRVLLLAENEVKIAELEQYIAENNGQIQVVETANLEEHGVSTDMILNRINGAEAECIIASLLPAQEEEFLDMYRTSLDAKVWFGVGTDLKWNRNTPLFRRIWNQVVGQFFEKKE